MRTVITALLVFVSVLGFSQEKAKITQTIRGTIIDKVTQATLPGATVIILNTNPIIGTTTDLKGEFEFENMEVGRYDLQVTFIGFYPTGVRNELLTSGKQLVLNIEIEEQAFVTDEIVVRAKQEKDQAINEMATVSARSFTVEETERYAGSLGDPSRMASNFAGVSMVNDQRNDIVIRGNSPSGVLWRLDGVEIPNPNHFGAAGTTGGPVSMLNNNLLTNSDFLTSAFPAQYGNAMSGVFDLNMRTGNNQEREYLAQVGFNGFELGAEGPFTKDGKGSYIINYRYSTLGAMQAMGINFGTGAAIPQYQDLSFKIDLPTNKLGRFSLFGIGGLSYIELNDSEKELDKDDDNANYNFIGTDLNYGSDMGVLGFSHVYFLNKKTSINTYLSMQAFKATTVLDSLKFDDEGNVIKGSNYRYYGGENTEMKYSASTHLKRRVNSRNNFVVGMYFDLYHIKANDSSLVNEPGFSGYSHNFDIDGQIPIIRAYAQWQHRFSNAFKINAGVYTQHVDISKETTFEPRLGLSYKLNEKQTLSAGYGLHSQMQPRMYYFIQQRQDDGSYLETNKNMKLSKSHQLVLGYDNLIRPNFRIKTELYYQRLFDIPVSELEPQFSMINTGDGFGEFAPDSLVNTGTGDNYGIELTVEKFLSNNFYMLSTFSFFQSKYKGYDEVERNTAYNNNYVINALGGYEFKVAKHYSIAIDLKGNMAGGKRYVPIDMEASKESSKTEYDWDKAYESQYDTYFRIDLRISLKVDGRRLNQEWAVDLQNISNTQNIYSEVYNPRTQELARTYQTGFYPMVLYRITF